MNKQILFTLTLSLISTGLVADDQKIVATSIALSNPAQEEINIQLINAARTGNLAQVQALLAQGVNVNAAAIKTALEYAVYFNNIAIISALLAHPSINVTINERLILAAQIGNLTLVQTLLTQGANINTHNFVGHTALIIAAQNGHTQIVTTLLAYPDIDVNAHGNETDTALMHAAHNNHMRIVAALLAHPGINVNAHNIDGTTALMREAFTGHTATLNALLAHPSIDVNAHDNHGITALMLAVASEHITIINTLLARPGIDIHARNRDNQTALDIARELGREDIARLLIEHDAH